MGYETRLIIGKECYTADELAYEYDDEYIRTGRKETYFRVYATIDLCKCGYDSAISKIDWTNEDENHFLYWYEGDKKIKEDLYDEKPKPVPIYEVIKALEKDAENDDYRRFKWALALLNSMKDDNEEITVLFYGH